MHRSVFVFLFFAAILVSACEKRNIVANQTRQVKNEGWTWNDSLQFEFDISDTTHLYNLWVEIHHSDTFKWQNVYCRLNTQYPDGKKQSQVVNFEMADGSGKWAGECSGKSCQLELPLQESAFFNQVGKYRLSIAQFMRIENLAGINEWQLRVEKTEQLKAKKK